MLSEFPRVPVPALLTMLCGSLAASGATAQVPVKVPTDPLPAVSLSLRVEQLYLEGRHRESLTLLERHLEGSPGDYAARVLAARESLILEYGASDPDSAKVWLHRAIAHGEGALALDPTGVDGRYVSLAAKGRLALLEGPRTKARLGVEVERDALSLLESNSLHAGAHNAVGRVYMEIAGLSWLERFMARPWLGGALLSRSTWDAAELHLRRAVELQPERNFNHLDLGDLLLDRGRLEEAKVVLDEALRVPLEIPSHEGFRAEARLLLDEIGRREARASEGPPR